MWSWHGVDIFLLILFLISGGWSIASTVRFIRSRSRWPLSSPDLTRKPQLIVATTTMATMLAALHLARQIADEDFPCVLYVLILGGLVQGLCLVFEIRLYSLLFMFECTENLCNMNEHRKQKAQLVADMEREKLDNQGILGLQLQSPPQSQVRGPTVPQMALDSKFSSPATRRLEVQPAQSPDGTAVIMSLAPPETAIPLKRRSLQANPLSPRDPIADPERDTTSPEPPTVTKVASWVARRQADALALGGVASAITDASPPIPARHASPSPRGATNGAPPTQNNFFDRGGSLRRAAVAKATAAAAQQQDGGDTLLTNHSSDNGSPESGVEMVNLPPRHNKSTKPQRRRSKDDHSATAEDNASTDGVVHSSQDGSKAAMRRSYIRPNWYVDHRQLIKPRFLKRWLLFWNVLLYAVLIILIFAEPHDSSHLYNNKDARNNLECSIQHVAGLQFIWSLVGCHLVFLAWGAYRLFDRFPMDGFRVKQELYMVGLLCIPSIVLHLAIPSSLESGIFQTSMTYPGGTLLSTLVDPAGGTPASPTDAVTVYTYFSTDRTDAFPVDLFFNILLPFFLAMAVTEGPLRSVEPGDATTDLLSTEADLVANLEELLATKHGFASFFTFLKTEFTMQNLLFWRACRNFQAAIDDHRYVLRNTTESLTGDLIGHFGGEPLADGILSGLVSTGSSEGDRGDLASAAGVHHRGLNTHHSPRNSVLSLSVGGVGLKVQRTPAALYAHPAHAHLLQQAPSLSGGKLRGAAGPRAASPGGGVLENVMGLPHPPRNANLPPGAISPSVTSMNSLAGAFAGAANPYLVAHALSHPPNTSLLRQPAGGRPAAEGSVLSVGAVIQARFSSGGGGGGGGARGGGLPGGSVEIPLPDAAELADPRLRIARLQKYAAALAMEHTRMHSIKLLEKARSIHERFVRDGAPYEVRDIGGDLRDHILEFMSLLQAGFKSPVDQVADIGKIFVDSQEFVYDLLSTDAFPRYLRSPFFTKFKANARARAALQQVRIQKVTRARQLVAMQEAAAAAAARPRRPLPSAATDPALMGGGRYANGLGFSRVNSSAAAGHVLAAPLSSSLVTRSLGPAQHAQAAIGSSPTSEDERETERGIHHLNTLSQSLRPTSPASPAFSHRAFEDGFNVDTDRDRERGTAHRPTGSMDDALRGRMNSTSSREHDEAERDRDHDGDTHREQVLQALEDSPMQPIAHPSPVFDGHDHSALPPMHTNARSSLPALSPIAATRSPLTSISGFSSETGAPSPLSTAVNSLALRPLTVSRPLTSAELSAF